jgi:ATP-dependent Lon protease
MEPIPPQDSIPLPDSMPVMVLSDCYLFPGCFLPLFIFEERYRAMLRHALDGNRMFCIGTRTNETETSVLPWSTAGLIRACVRQPDGTSHVMLYGVRRINITGWETPVEQEQPFQIAKVEPIEVARPPADAAEALVHEALNLLPTPTPTCSDAMQKLKSTLSAMSCPDRVCDILAYHFVREPKALKTLLASTDPLQRLRVLNGELRRL